MRSPEVSALDDYLEAGLPIASAIESIGRALTTERVSLAKYMRESWAIVEPGTQYVLNWHIELMAEYLEAVHCGEISRLIFNIPPRFTKSLTVSIQFPTWEWTDDPTIRFMFAGYAQELLTKHNIDRRLIVESPWYQKRWGESVRMAPDQNRKTVFQNTARGHMMTSPTGGSATGLGGNRLILHDLMNPREADRKAERPSAPAFNPKTFSTRP